MRFGICRRRGRWRAALLLAAVAVIAPPRLWSDVLEEYAAKAALTFHFARYTDWPEAAVAASPHGLRVCVAGDAAAGEAFEAIAGRRVGERQIRVRLLRSRDDPDGCDLLFIDGRDRQRIALLLSGLRDRPVLTIGEIPGFADYGGIVNLYRSQGRIRFEVSLRAAARAGLAVSSRLLRLARIVE